MSETPAYTVLLWAAQEAFSGRIVFEREERIKHFYLKAGTLLGSRSNLVPEGIDIILRRGFLPTAELLSVQNFGARASRDEDWDAGIVERLKGRELIEAGTLRVALSVQLRERVTTLFGWFDGRYAVQEGVSPSEHLPLPPPLPLSILFREVEAFLLEGKVPENTACPEYHLPTQGTLRDTGGASIFTSLALRGGSGKLLFERGQRRKLFKLERGVVTSAVSSDPGETLAEVLRRWQFLRGDVIARLESTARSKKAKFRDLLRHEELLSDSEISSAVRILHAERILEAFSWRSGTYEFRGGFSEDAAQKPEFRGASEIDATTSVREEEHTEKEVPLAKALSKLFGDSPANALLLVEVPFRGSLEPVARTMAAEWHESDGTKTLLVCLGQNLAKGADPTFWPAPGEYSKWLISPDGQNGVDLLPLVRENKRWRSSDGLMIFHRFATYVNSKYDRVLWLVPPPSPGSPLLTSVGRIVFVVSRDRTERAHLTELVRQSSRAQSAGFIFRDRPRQDTWGSLRERFIRNRDPRHPRS